jgi:hypothetical protein
MKKIKINYLRDNINYLTIEELSEDLDVTITAGRDSTLNKY